MTAPHDDRDQRSRSSEGTAAADELDTDQDLVDGLHRLLDDQQ